MVLGQKDTILTFSSASSSPSTKKANKLRIGQPELLEIMSVHFIKFDIETSF